MIPDFINVFNEYSIPMFVPLSSIIRTSILGEPAYLALTVAHQYSLAEWLPNSYGSSNRIAYQISANLTDWTAPVLLRSAITWFADGYGYDASVIDPVAYERDGKLHLLMASADGDVASEIGRDGKHDCSPPSAYGVTAPYVGTGIYEATIEPVTLRPTRTEIQLDAAAVADGTMLECTVHVTGLDGAPLDGIVMISGGWLTFARVNAGEVRVAIPMHGIGRHTVQAIFQSQGIWDGSVSAPVFVDVMRNYRRRAVHR